MTTYYRAYWSPEVDGIHVGFEEWVSIHESPCYHYCVRDYYTRMMPALLGGQSALQYAKSRKINVKRIDKVASRFAKPTKGLALNHMLFRQSRRLQHLRRDIAFIEALLDRVKVVDDSENELDDFIVHGTKSLLNDFLVFD